MKWTRPEQFQGARFSLQAEIPHTCKCNGIASQANVMVKTKCPNMKFSVKTNLNKKISILRSIFGNHLQI